jgi:uroporphyrinogen decarboxylase
VSEMTSRERLLAAIRHETPDRVPICFRGVKPLDIRWNSRFERILGLQEMGVDDKLSIRVPWVYHPEVQVKQWWERRAGDRYPLIAKELQTPKGALRLVVRETADYAPEDLLLVADHNWPRGVEFPIKGRDDLERLRFLLRDPRKADLSGFREHARALKSFAVAHGVLTEGTLPSISDTLFSLCGPHAVLYQVMDDRDFVTMLLRMIHEWTLWQLEILLDLGIDTIYSQGCYETTEFWSPQMIRELFLSLRKEAAAWIHQAGSKFHYFTQTGIMPLLDDYRQAGIDILSALDPLGVGGARLAVNLAETKRRIGDRICLWGGVDPEHTIELGSVEDIRAAVRSAIEACAPGGGFVLSTSGSIYRHDQTTYEHVLAFIQAAHEFGRY